MWSVFIACRTRKTWALFWDTGSDGGKPEQAEWLNLIVNLIVALMGSVDVKVWITMATSDWFKVCQRRDAWPDKGESWCYGALLPHINFLFIDQLMSDKAYLFACRGNKDSFFELWAFAKIWDCLLSTGCIIQIFVCWCCQDICLLGVAQLVSWQFLCRTDITRKKIVNP